MPILEKELQEPESIKLLRSIADSTHTLCVKMLGSSDPNDEQQTGRLPLVEAKAESAHRRIDKLRLQVAYFSGGLAVVLFAMKLFGK